MRRRRSAVLAAVAALGVIAGAGAPTLASGAPQPSPKKTTISPTFERTIGGPGHAGLYAWGMATMRDGTILVGDYWNYRVLRYNPDGTPVGTGVFINNSGNGANQYYTPYGLGVDPRNGDVYMADTDKYQIDVYNEAGTFLRSWGGKGAGPGKFLYPSRVVVNSVGTVFVADTWEHSIVLSDTTGAEIRQIGGFGTKDGQIKSPHGMALDANDNLYVADSGNWRISVFDKAGNFLRKWGSKGAKNGQFMGDMRGVAVDKVNGWVYVVDGEGNKVSKFDLTGKFLAKWGGMGSGNGQFADGGREATVDGTGNVWVADMPNYRAQKFAPTGAFLMSFPNPVVPPAPGLFNAPRGVAVSPLDGQVAVSDTYNWRIETFTNAGAFVQQFGSRGRGPYKFNYARSVAYSPLNGDIIVTDTDNGRIHAYTAAGVFKWSTGIAGKGGIGQFRNPQALAVASDGTIYVTDSNNMRIQVLSATGALLRMFGSTAEFGYPRGIAIDPVNGSLWVADSAKDKITNWSTTGTLVKTLSIPRGTADNALDGPFGIAVDPERVYVVDTPTHKVKVFTKTGTFVTKISQRGTAAGKLLQPALMDLYGGRLYIAEQGNDRVSVFNLNTR